MNQRKFQATRLGGGHQQGAVLYVALIMLILLALIGVVGMQVASMQERMSANYLASNQAFQQAELQVREREADITSGGEYDYEECNVPFEPVEWANEVGNDVGSEVRTRNVSICNRQCSAGAGVDVSEQPCNMFRTTAFSRNLPDDAAASSSLAAVDTIFIRP
ncbi:PilX N-terminal domain-containing pilus assembly protein [Stenotrophomonas sp. HITSZ_GD]|jgi:type IV pilus assembly protein PilX|uniref:pilus assembly PilX family protein n=1 Tax=Stenotrophomonas sp. HITSZ_GD TaxID=3037248 RepID=UPI00240E976E|nr:PilX N-terminal domain-containing pilus assembly protein [Stenotrophomonas sp. HITSZ_GD]MDG2524563.1 PilX N-terminal domain-containing pilus assembly protein [Stenotrophomonas sp. HITSZ_GD]